MIIPMTISLLLLAFNTRAGIDLSLVKKAFPNYTKMEKLEVIDSIGDKPVNTSLYKVFKKNGLEGFARSIETTTGCNSACLPISYTSFYDAKGSYLKLLSRVGLTKIGHAPFTDQDYAKLDLILALAPKELGEVVDPKDMTDALSGATLKTYAQSVVKGAAYSTLRIHLYNQLTLKQISSKLLDIKE